MMADPVRPHPDGTVVAVRAVPGASAAKVMGLHGDELRVRVCSPPIDGRANDELCEVLAAALGLRARDVTVVAGHSSRSKLLLVAAPQADVWAALSPWIGRSEAPER
jgi:uncharacterized protein (TIGR00251 family)